MFSECFLFWVRKNLFKKQPQGFDLPRCGGGEKFASQKESSTPPTFTECIAVFGWSKTVTFLWRPFSPWVCRIVPPCLLEKKNWWDQPGNSDGDLFSRVRAWRCLWVLRCFEKANIYLYIYRNSTRRSISFKAGTDACHYAILCLLLHLIIKKQLFM